ncbi:MAG: DUF6129 family protein [Methylomonas sp.]|nr:DUF6129 family protein [Methylomonas sp.]
MISSEQLQRVAAAIRSGTLSESLVATLRSENPGIHFTYCMDDDLPNHEPVLEDAGFNLYLVDGREHCLRLTSNYEHATGIVIAEVLDD